MIPIFSYKTHNSAGYEPLHDRQNSQVMLRFETWHALVQLMLLSAVVLAGLSALLKLAVQRYTTPAMSDLAFSTYNRQNCSSF